MDYRIWPLAPMSGEWETTNLRVRLLDGRDHAICTACIRAEATGIDIQGEVQTSLAFPWYC